MVYLLIGFGITFFLIVGNYVLNDLTFYLDADEVEVTELYELKNGNLYVTLEADGSQTRTSSNFKMSGRYEDGTYGYDGNDWIKIGHNLVETLNDTPQRSTISMEVEVGKSWLGMEMDKESQTLSYKGENKELLIWERGQEVKAAPDYIEEAVRRGNLGGYLQTSKGEVQ